MPRPRRFRKNTHLRTQLSWSQEGVMSVTPPSPSRSSLRGRNTGFPDSFCGQRNTTLPHPDANLSPDAVLTEDDISVGRALARHRASYLVDRKPMTLGEPFLASSSSVDYCPSPTSLNGSTDKFATIGSLALASLRGADHLARHPHHQQQEAESRSSRDGDSSALSSGGSSGGNSPTHAHAPKDLGRLGKRRRSFLWRLAHR